MCFCIGVCVCVCVCVHATSICVRENLQGPHAGKFSVKYKDDPNCWTHSLLREGYGKDRHWVLLLLPSRDSA